MNIISLDLSTKPGYAIFKGTKRIASGTSFPKRSLDKIDLKYPRNYLKLTQEVVELLLERVNFHLPRSGIHPYDISAVVIEETTSSSQNYSQKKLEFIHYEFLKRALDIYKNAQFVYIRDGVWKDVCKARMNAAEKRNNAKFSRLKAQKKKKNPKLKRIVINKDSKGNPIKRITEQDAYVRRANELFKLGLTAEQEDQAAALLLGWAYMAGAPVCDGKTTGGLVKK